MGNTMTFSSPEELQAAAKQHLWMHFTRMSAYNNGDIPVIVRGSGPYVYDDKGKRYLDGLAGLFVSMIGLRCDGDLEKLADQLAAMEEIDYVVITAGSFDLLLEVVCEDDDHLLEILSQVRGVPSVRSTETLVYLKLRKQTYTWGTR